MDEETLSRLNKYESYLVSQAREQRQLSQCANLAGRGVAQGKASAFSYALSQLQSTFPELRASEPQQLEQSSQITPRTQSGSGHNFSRLRPETKA